MSAQWSNPFPNQPSTGANICVRPFRTLQRPNRTGPLTRYFLRTKKYETINWKTIIFSWAHTLILKYQETMEQSMKKTWAMKTNLTLSSSVLPCFNAMKHEKNKKVHLQTQQDGTRNSGNGTHAHLYNQWKLHLSNHKVPQHFISFWSTVMKFQEVRNEQTVTYQKFSQPWPTLDQQPYECPVK